MFLLVYVLECNQRAMLLLVAPMFCVKAYGGKIQASVTNDRYYLHTLLYLHLRYSTIAVVHHGDYEIFLKIHFRLDKGKEQKDFCQKVKNM